MRALSVFADIVCLTLLMALACVPVVTVGAALSTGYDTARRSLSGEPMSRAFLRGLRANLGKGIALWGVMGGCAVGLGALWWFVGLLPVRMMLSLAAGLWAITFVWLWPVQSRFENSVVSTLRNALLFALGWLPRTILLLVADAGWVALIWASWRFMPQGLFLLVVTGPGLLTYLHVQVCEPAFARLG